MQGTPNTMQNKPKIQKCFIRYLNFFEQNIQKSVTKK